MAKLTFPGFVPPKKSTDEKTEIKNNSESEDAKSTSKKTGAGITHVSAEASTNLREDYDRLKKEEHNFKTKEKQFKEKEKKLESEISLLKAEQDRVKKLVEEEGEFRTDIDPRECQAINIPGRIQKLLNEKRCEDLIKDFNSHIGQKEAIYIRPIPDNVEKIHDGIKFETFAGTRRRWSGEYVVNEYNPDFRLKAFIKNVSDEEASVFTEKENAKEEWADIEFGFFYSDLMAKGVYKTRKELAQKRNISEDAVRRYLMFGELRGSYPEIIQAFDELTNLLDLRQLWVKKLLTLLEDESKRKAILNKSKSFLKEKKNISASVLYNELIKAAESTQKNKKAEEVIQAIKNKNNDSIGSLKRSSVNNIDIKIKSKSNLTKEQIKEKLCEFIDKYYEPTA